jgi:sialate O-acetylesterase
MKQPMGWIGMTGMLLLGAFPAQADLRLSAIFGDNMVLQQNVDAPVWGWAAPGRDVTVSLAGRQASGKADAQGRWQVKVPVPKADGKPLLLQVESGDERVSLTNVLAGEVWLCSGQSNMKHPLHATQGGKEATASADNPAIRLFQVDMWCAPQPLDDLRGQWKISSPLTAGGFSAVGYYMGRELQRTLGIPVGIIDSTSGGTAAEAWISRDTLIADPQLKSLWREDPAFFATVTQYEKDRAEYDRAKLEKRNPLPPYPKTPFRGWGYPASSFYNAMIAPLSPFAIKGAAWYQGEARTGRPLQYEQELTTLIKDWRARWNQGDFTFLVVQLPRITPVWGWPPVREGQLNVSRKVPNVGLAVTIDLQDPDLHPAIKEPVGKRLALAAMGLAYGRKADYTGPRLESFKVEENRVRLNFKSTDGGLVAAGGGDLQGFAIAGEDRQFVPAKAVIENDTLVITSPDVIKPVAVRYAFEDNPTCNLAGRDGLPASPFRTDTWPLEEKK